MDAVRGSRVALAAEGRAAMTPTDSIRLTQSEIAAVLLQVGFTAAELELPPGPPATVIRLAQRPRLRAVEGRRAEGWGG